MVLKLSWVFVLVFSINAKANYELKNVSLRISADNALVNCLIEAASSLHLPGASSKVAIDSFIEPVDEKGINRFASVSFDVYRNSSVEHYKIRIASLGIYGGWFYDNNNDPFTNVSAVIASLEKFPTGEHIGLVDLESCQ